MVSGQILDRSSWWFSFSFSPLVHNRENSCQIHWSFFRSKLDNHVHLACITSARMWYETTASQSGFFVSKRTRTISNLLNKGPESVVLTDRASLCWETTLSYDREEHVTTKCLHKTYSKLQWKEIIDATGNLFPCYKMQEML